MKTIPIRNYYTDSELNAMHVCIESTCLDLYPRYQ